MVYVIRLDDNKSFLDFRIKDKKQIMDIWMYISERLLINRYEVVEPIPQFDQEMILLIKQNDYWRIYIIDANISLHKKIVIISFPFNIKANYFEGTRLESIRLTYQNENIDFKQISMIKSTMQYMFSEVKPLTIYDSIIATLQDIESDKDCYGVLLNNIIVGLLSFNDGYIRYDFDPKNENSDIHPLYHLDIFFNKESTFKIGLPNKYEVNDLISLLDKNKPCRFLR